MKRLYPILVYLLLIVICISIINLQNTNAKNNILTYEKKSDTISDIEIDVIGSETQTIKSQSINIEPVIIIEKDVMPEYDIPLSRELQEFTYSKCKEYGVSYDLVLAIMKTESNFKHDVVNKNTNNSVDSGLMQINSIHKEEFYKKGFTDIFDPYQNIEYGISYLAELYKKFDDNEHYVAAAFNKGEYGFRKLLDRGITSTNYSRKVMENKLILNKNIKGGDNYE